jgi:hypothetical protein
MFVAFDGLIGVGRIGIVATTREDRAKKKRSEDIRSKRE